MRQTIESFLQNAFHSNFIYKCKKMVQNTAIVFCFLFSAFLLALHLQRVEYVRQANVHNISNALLCSIFPFLPTTSNTMVFQYLVGRRKRFVTFKLISNTQSQPESNVLLCVMPLS